MEEMMLRAAKMAVAVRIELGRAKPDPAAKYYTYTLMLRNNKFYVGSTDNIYLRLLEHCLMTPASASWVKEWGPPTRLLDVIRKSRGDTEKYKTLEMMSMFSYENVRGAQYCRVDMRRPPIELEHFERQTSGPLEYLTVQEVADIWRCVQTMTSDLRRSENMHQTMMIQQQQPVGTTYVDDGGGGGGSDAHDVDAGRRRLQRRLVNIGKTQQLTITEEHQEEEDGDDDDDDSK
jgi:hypothetical protein